MEMTVAMRVVKSDVNIASKNIEFDQKSSKYVAVSERYFIDEVAVSVIYTPAGFYRYTIYALPESVGSLTLNWLVCINKVADPDKFTNDDPWLANIHGESLEQAVNEAHNWLYKSAMDHRVN